MEDELIVAAEERSDVIILRRLMERALGLEPTFYSTRGQMSIAELARGIFWEVGGPVVIAKDAHTGNPALLEEIWSITRAGVGIMAPQTSFEVHLFIPEMEVIFFEAPCVLRRHLGRAIEGMELELGMLAPRRQMDRLLAEAGTDREAFYRALDDADLDCLLAGTQMQALIAGAQALLARHAPYAHA